MCTGWGRYASRAAVLTKVRTKPCVRPLVSPSLELLMPLRAHAWANDGSACANDCDGGQGGLRWRRNAVAREHSASGQPSLRRAGRARHDRVWRPGRGCRWCCKPCVAVAHGYAVTIPPVARRSSVHCPHPSALAPLNFRHAARARTRRSVGDARLLQLYGFRPRHYSRIIKTEP